MIRVAVEGDSLRGLAGELIQEEMPRAIAVVDTAAAWVEEEIHRNLRRPAPGRAGAPAGESPYLRTGELDASVSRTRARATPSNGVVSASIRVDHPGANRLEYGGVDSRGIVTAPHPFVRTAFEKLRSRIVALWEGL